VKPPIFDYDAPTTVDETLALLERHVDDVKVLAGGQSLVPLLNFRLSRPGRLIDINNVSELAYITRSEGTLRIGALTRHAALERSRIVATGWPVLTEALTFLAHAQIRNRGTVGGSVAHADPAAELPVAFAALDACFHARSTRGSRVIGWRDFFVTHLTSVLEPDELLTEIEVPAQPPRTGGAFVEYARRHGDFALGGACATVSLGDDGRCTQATIALLAAAPTPLRSEAAEDALAGTTVDEPAAARAAALAVEGVEPTGDIHGSSAYRKKLITAMVRRAVVVAADRAKSSGDAA
jgi:carbon-monoxide dehydrogenase medium subunit/6-hydroxypseudooxynicotine dehydrogenase subunit alpha